MSKTRKELIAVLDLGTTKVVCLIASVDATGHVRIEGIGHHLSTGLRSGVVTDIQAAEASIAAAVDLAEKMAGERIDHVVVNLSGGQLVSHTVRTDMALQQHPVSRQDIARLIRHGRESLHNDETSVIHCIPISFTIDEVRGVRNPEGMYGKKMGAELHVITASTMSMRNLTKCVARAQLDISEFLVSAYASGLACLTEDEMELGVTLLDIGGGTTSVAVFVEGQPVFTDIVPLGGQHVSNDIARGLSVSLETAERLKALYGATYTSVSNADDIISVGTNNGDAGQWDHASVSRSMLCSIIRPRMEELFEIVRGQLEAVGFDKVAGRRMVLTGGSSQLIGVADLAAQMFRKQVRLGKPKQFDGMAETISGSSFATSIGLVEYAARKMHANRQMKIAGSEQGRWRFDRAIQWVKEHM